MCLFKLDWNEANETTILFNFIFFYFMDISENKKMLKH